MLDDVIAWHNETPAPLIVIAYTAAVCLAIIWFPKPVLFLFRKFKAWRDRPRWGGLLPDPRANCECARMEREIRAGSKCVSECRRHGAPERILDLMKTYADLDALKARVEELEAIAQKCNMTDGKPLDDPCFLGLDVDEQPTFIFKNHDGTSKLKPKSVVEACREEQHKQFICAHILQARSILDDLAPDSVNRQTMESMIEWLSEKLDDNPPAGSPVPYKPKV